MKCKACGCEYDISLLDDEVKEFELCPDCFASVVKDKPWLLLDYRACPECGQVFMSKNYEYKVCPICRAEYLRLLEEHISNLGMGRVSL